MNRWHYLSIGSICAISGVAGCLSLIESDVQLASITATNAGDEKRTIEIQVLDDGSEIQQSELRLDSPELEDGRGRVLSTETVECGWGSESKSYTLETRLDDEWETLDVASKTDADCVFVVIRVGFSPGPDMGYRVYPCEDLDASDEEFACQFVDLD